MNRIKINSWVITKRSQSQSIVATPALHVEAIIEKDGKTLYRVSNPMFNETFDYTEGELIEISAPISEMELKVLLAFKEMPSEWYEPLSAYISELRNRLGLGELFFPYIVTRTNKNE